MAVREKPYPFDEIEPKWQRYWVTKKTFRSPDPGEAASEKLKYYVLDMFPYPSASGLHVGHLEGYTATDIAARYKRMRGFNVLHPIGWDAFGLPAEQFAVETKTHPRVVTKRNIDNFRRQIQALGFSYDWDREIDTTDKNYYRWTQWIFLKLFEKNLAYQAEALVNWCPALGTVLANEEVIDGKSERGGHPVVRKPMRQWMLKITEYADRLLKDLEDLDWPESIKEMQRNWIGKSEGAEVDFPIEGRKEKIRIFTTRPDTLFGATYMVLAPENSLVEKLTIPEYRKAVETYREAAAGKSDLQRTDLAKEKTGVFTGAYAVNPVNGKKIPIWIADYVLMGYGTGAIMAVPAHDERDYEFAKKYALPIVEVISGGDISTASFTGIGMVRNSRAPDGSFSMDGLPSDQAIPKITAWLESKGIGKRAVHYRLRDWLFSRQRYWGEPIPLIHCPQCGAMPVDESELPLALPDLEDFRPHNLEVGPWVKGSPFEGSGLTIIERPLDRARNVDGTKWKDVNCPHCHKPAQRETNTMPQWAGSCWYYLRFLDPKNGRELVSREKEKYWMPVDLYVGGAEHAVLHLLYARFWHKVLYDCGIVSTKEPFARLVNQGVILGEDGQKMSKSLGNVVNPDELLRDYGADSIRLYEMFLGPLEMMKPWNTQGLEGVSRFLGRVWRLMTGDAESRIKNTPPSEEELKILHRTIKKVTEDLESLKFHTAISALMVFVNDMMKLESRSKSVLETFVLLLAPFAPHISEELWQMIGHDDTLAYEPWPVYEERYLAETEVEIAIQVLGKIRSRLIVPKGMGEADLKERVLKDETLKKWIDCKPIRKMIVVPERLVNIIV